jgi:hypothetical protein
MRFIDGVCQGYHSQVRTGTLRAGQSGKSWANQRADRRLESRYERRADRGRTTVKPIRAAVNRWAQSRSWKSREVQYAWEDARAAEAHNNDVLGGIVSGVWNGTVGGAINLGGHIVTNLDKIPRGVQALAGNPGGSAEALLNASGLNDPFGNLGRGWDAMWAMSPHDKAEFWSSIVSGAALAKIAHSRLPGPATKGPNVGPITGTQAQLGPLVEGFVYRSGRKPRDFRLRPSDDGLLSTRSSISNPVAGGPPGVLRGDYVTQIDVSRLPPGSVIVDSIDGHASILMERFGLTADDILDAAAGDPIRSPK